MNKVCTSLLVASLLTCSLVGCNEGEGATLGESSYLDEFNCLHVDSTSEEWLYFNELVLENFESFSSTLREGVDEDSVAESYQWCIAVDQMGSFCEGNEVKFCAVPNEFINSEYDYVMEVKDTVLGAVEGYQFCLVGRTLGELYSSFDKVFGEMGLLGEKVKENYEVGQVSTLSFAVSKDQVNSEKFVSIGESSDNEVYFSITIEGSQEEAEDGSIVFVAQIVFQTDGNGLVPCDDEVPEPYLDSVADYCEELVVPKVNEVIDGGTLGETGSLLDSFFPNTFNYCTVVSFESSSFNEAPTDKETTFYCLLEFSNESSLLLGETFPIVDLEYSSVNKYLESMEELESNEYYLELIEGCDSMVLGDEKLIQGYENFSRVVIKNLESSQLQEFSNALRETFSEDSLRSQWISSNDDGTSNLIVEVFY